jgi:hypothetical protein
VAGARTFDGASDNVICEAGATTATTFGTFAAIIKRNSTALNGIVALHNSAPNFIVGLEILDHASGDFAVYGSASGDINSAFTVTNADGWILLVCGKATGTATPRFHKYVYSTDTWTHSNGGGTLANTSGTVDNVKFGMAGAGTGADFAGDLAVSAVWKNRQLTDTEVEQLAFSLMGWHATTPTALWVFDQSATTQNVIDLTGGAANQRSTTGNVVSTNSVPVFSYGHPVLLATHADVVVDVPYNPQRYVQLRDYGEVPWIQRDRRDVDLIATAANDLAPPLLVPEHQRSTTNLVRYADRREVPQQPERHLRALDATAADDLAPPLMAPADAQYWHLYNDVPLRNARAQQRTYSDPSLLTPVAADIPAAAPVSAAAYAERRVAPKQRAYADPTLLSSALLENELLGGAETDKRTNVPATHADRREVPQQRTYYDTSLLNSALLESGLLGSGDTGRHYLVAATHYSRRLAGQQRVYYDLTLLASALLENELLGGAETLKRHLPATHYSRRLVPQQRSYVSDTGLLATALLEDVLLSGADNRRFYNPAAYIRRQSVGYQPRWPDLSQPADVFDPASVAGDLLRRLVPATHADRREIAFQSPRRTLYFDAGPDSPPLTLAWGVGGDLWHRYNPRRPARSWWPQWFSIGPYDVGGEVCITIRPLGLTVRPGAGVTSRPGGSTARPGTGVTDRPDSGVTEDPC